MRGRGKIVHGRGRGIARVNYAEEKDDELVDMFEQSASTHDVYIANLNAETNNCEWTVKMKIQNKYIFLEIDSGAQCNVLSRKVAEKFKSISPIKKRDASIN